MSRMQARFSRKEYGFVPDTYVLPGDLGLLKAVWVEGDTWIKKPVCS
jgi:tubulin polyglutamylase TTLL4